MFQKCSAKGLEKSLYWNEARVYGDLGLFGTEIDSLTPDFKSYGHFSQIVWRGSRELGVGYCTRDKRTVVIIR